MRFRTNACHDIAKHMKILIFDGHDGHLRLNTCATRRACKILYLRIQIFFNVKKQTGEKNE